MYDYSILLAFLFVLLAIALIVLVAASWTLSEGAKLRVLVTTMLAEILDPRRRRYPLELMQPEFAIHGL